MLHNYYMQEEINIFQFLFFLLDKLMTSVFCLSEETGRCKEKQLWVVLLPAKRT